MNEPLSVTHPDLAAQWHPTRNDDLTADRVTSGSHASVWWVCPQSPDHEWKAPVRDRATKGRGCPFCSGQRVLAATSLATLHPDLSLEWHPTKNGSLSPEHVGTGSHQKVWWKCRKGPDHEWSAPIRDRALKAFGCPYCSGRRVSVTNSLATLHPDLAQEWHPTKNDGLLPHQVVAGSNRKIWWKCPKGPDHEWSASPNSRTRGGNGCPHCRGIRVSVTNSLASLRPDLAAQWHPTKNPDLSPDQVVAGSHLKVWWKCAKGLDHEWPAQILSRTSGGVGCPYCAGQRVSTTNSLASQRPDLIKEWHPSKNGEHRPTEFVAGSQKRVWWICSKDPSHEWRTSVANRAKLNSGCPYCTRRLATDQTSLSHCRPDIAAEWHPSKNGALSPTSVVVGSNRPVWWQCSRNLSHVWQTRIDHRTREDSGCPVCSGRGWLTTAIRGFVASLIDYLAVFEPAELYVLFQQSGLLRMTGSGRGFIRALATGRFPREELERFVGGQNSLVDHFVADPALTLEMADWDGTTRDELPLGRLDADVSEPDDAVGAMIDERQVRDERALPVVDAKEILGALNAPVVTSADEEAVEFLLTSAVAKLWKHAYRDEAVAVAQAERFASGHYAELARTRFLDEYLAATQLSIPNGYAFTIDEVLTLPNLMQRHVAVQVRERKRVGNWSGTGAGKTLSAVLASRVVGADLTIVCCPNSVVDGWYEAILAAFPASLIATKTFTPDWASVAADPTAIGMAASGRPRYVVLHYEAFQQPDSAVNVRALVEREQIDLLIVDEIHFAKQRSVENLSQRRRLVAALAAAASERNPDLHVLGMSATPVINTLHEGRSLVELVTGVEHADLDTKPTVPNCMRLHQRLVTLGTRWLPEYALGYEQIEVPIDCTPFLDDIRALGHKGTPLALEQVLTRARLPTIREHIRPKTLIYTHYVEGVDRLLRDAIMDDGWTVGFYIGDDKTGLDAFLHGDLDVLIGSSAIGTGVDGLQHVCNHLIINVLPWTAAEFEQLKGRVYRQGQHSHEVTLVLPLTYADVGGERWSWCESKMARLKFKKSIADAAVDGVVPERHLRTPAQAYQDVMGWLARLDGGTIEVVERPRMVVPLPESDAAEVDRRLRRYGDFSSMNRTWNQSRSETTHQRLQANPEEWAQYHTLYREARKDWAVVPFEEIIRWGKQRSGYVIGDFGCGEANLAEVLADRHVVHSFDHVAINDGVVACDMAHVPLDDGTLDVAVFSLALMGTNVADYLREAHRTLKLDGYLHILEATSRFSDRERFASGLKAFGFDVVAVEDKWKFTHVRALKTERLPQRETDLVF